MSSDPATFRAALDDLDPAVRVALVAAVYDARGWTTERVDGAVLVRPPGDPDAGRRVVPPGGDAATAGPDATVLDAATLREMVAYALDADDRDRLCRRYFDRTPTEVGVSVGPGVDGKDSGTAGDGAVAGEDDAEREGAETDASTGTGGGAGRGTDTGADTLPSTSRPRTTPALVAAAAAFVAVAVVVVTGQAIPVVDSPAVTAGDERTPPAEGSVSGDAGDGNGSDADDAGNAGGVVGHGPEAQDPPDPDSVVAGPTALDVSRPPGVGTDGVENASALAAAHERALSGRPYRLSVAVRESVDGRPTAVAWERTTVETPERYRSTVRVAGTFRRTPRAVARASTYADGTTRVVRLTNRTDADGRIRFTEPPTDGENATTGRRRVGPPTPSDRVADRTARYLRELLSGLNTTVAGTFERGDTTYVWLVIRSRPVPGPHVTGTVLVDERGLVHEIRRERTFSDVDESLVRTAVTIRVTPGNATVAPPSWVETGGQVASSVGANPRGPRSTSATSAAARS